MRSFAVLLALPFALLALSCGGGEKFVDAGLADAMSGAIPSKTDTYRLTSPEILVVKGDFALLRDGRAYQILTADGFEEIYPRLEGKAFKLLVRKWRNPYPHLRLEGYELGEERVDTKWVLGESDLPTLVEHRLYDVSLYESVDPAGWAGKLPADVAGKKIWMPAEVEFLGTEEIVVERAPAVADTADSSARETEAEEVASADASPDTGVVSRAQGAPRTVRLDQFALRTGGLLFQLSPIREDGIALLLRALAAENRILPLGGYVSEINPSRPGGGGGPAGMFKLELFDFGGKYVLERK
jgi:hypothetical protein